MSGPKALRSARRGTLPMRLPRFRRPRGNASRPLCMGRFYDIATPVPTVATNPAPGAGDVDAWLAAVRADLRRVAAAIEPLLQEQTQLRDREALLIKLLQSLTSAGSAAEQTNASGTASQTSARPEGSILEYVRSCVLEVLRENGGPMHINDIHAKFLSKGFRVPGAGRPANLTAHLGRCSGITSPSRGFYAIGESVDRPRRRKRR